MLVVFVGFEVITKVPPLLHTPLMSGSNAISGITIIGAILSAASPNRLTVVLGFAALVLATQRGRRLHGHEPHAQHVQEEGLTGERRCSRSDLPRGLGAVHPWHPGTHPSSHRRAREQAGRHRHAPRHRGHPSRQSGVRRRDIRLRGDYCRRRPGLCDRSHARAQNPDDRDARNGCAAERVRRWGVGAGRRRRACRDRVDGAGDRRHRCVRHHRVGDLHGKSRRV